MQQDSEKLIYFKQKVGEVVKKVRLSKKISQNRFANEFDIDRGNLSKLENGILNCRIATAWKISEAANIKFSDFAKLLEKELGENFKLMDE